MLGSRQSIVYCSQELSFHGSFSHEMKKKTTFLTIKKTVTVRNFKAIDHVMYCIDVAHELESIDLEVPPDTLIDQFNSKMISVLDNHAPEQSQSRTVRPRCPWYDKSINDQRRLRRK